MKIIISPAKKMEECKDIFEPGNLPAFLDRTEILLERLRSMNEAELKGIFKANDQITRQNFLRFQSMNLKEAQTPALLAYVGIQYQYMAPQLFSYEQWEYVKRRLRILSGFYGILKPDDKVTPYRLEMQARLRAGEKKDLYDFWGKTLYETLTEEWDEGEPPVILNLASKEYSKAVEPYLEPGVRFVTCVFGERTGEDGKLKVKATEAKMARGEMVRFMAERGISDVDEIREFSCLGYRYEEKESTDQRFVYVKKREAGRLEE